MVWRSGRFIENESHLQAQYSEDDSYDRGHPSSDKGLYKVPALALQDTLTLIGARTARVCLQILAVLCSGWVL